MFGFGTGLVAGKEYWYDIIVHADGLTGRHGRDMVFDCAGSFTAEDGVSRERAEAKLRTEAIDAAHKELPGAYSYKIIKFVAR